MARVAWYGLSIAGLIATGLILSLLALVWSSLGCLLWFDFSRLAGFAFFNFCERCIVGFCLQNSAYRIWIVY